MLRRVDVAADDGYPSGRDDVVGFPGLPRGEPEPHGATVPIVLADRLVTRKLCRGYGNEELVWIDNRARPRDRGVERSK